MLRRARLAPWTSDTTDSESDSDSSATGEASSASSDSGKSAERGGLFGLLFSSDEVSQREMMIIALVVILLA